MIRYILIACILPLWLADTPSVSANEPSAYGYKLDLKPYVIDTNVEPIVTITLPKNSGATVSGPEIILPSSKISLKLGKQHFSVIQLHKDGSLDRVSVYPAAA